MLATTVLHGSSVQRCVGGFERRSSRKGRSNTVESQFHTLLYSVTSAWLESVIPRRLAAGGVLRAVNLIGQAGSFDLDVDDRDSGDARIDAGSVGRRASGRMGRFSEQWRDPMTGRTADRLRPPAAIIVGIDRDPGLQAARILSARGVPIIGVAIDRDHFACRTRVCDAIHYADDYEGIVDVLEKIGPELTERAVVVPCSDPAVEQISKQRARLEPWFHVPLPSAETVSMLMDKTRFYAYAQSNGFPIPKTRMLSSRAEAIAAGEALDFPCALKPPFRTAAWVENTKEKAIKVETPAELIEAYDKCKEWADQLIVQEWIVGGDDALYSLNCYFDASAKPLATFVAKKLRQWPLEAGDSSLGEECRNDVVLEESVRLFRSVDYHGLGYVEMKQDSRTGVHYIIEPNVARPTGRSAIAEAGGVELLYTMYCDLVGHPLPAERIQTYGDAKWIYLRKDLQAALRQRIDGSLTIRDWWRSLRGRKVYAVWSVQDPLPFLYDIWNTAKKVARPVGRRILSGASKQQRGPDGRTLAEGS